VAQRIDHPDEDAANALALLDLEGGADALLLVTDTSPYHRGFGLAIGELDRVFDGIELDFIGLRIDAGPGTSETVAALARLISDRRLTSAALPVDVGFDPIGWRARLGHPVDDAPDAVLDARAASGLSGTVFLADGRPWHEAGAGEAQELAAVLATAVAYLKRQDAWGIPLDEARRHIALLLATDADVFLGLAKFRAIRRLWASVEAACGLTPAPVRVHAETSWRMMTRHDPWTNVMRTTAATFAAGLGGADAVTVLPFTLPLGLPDDAARRLARNIQRILLDEAHLAQVEDPGAGAGGFEALTDGLCHAAWAMFQDIEREGGIERTIETGLLAARIAQTAQARANGAATLTRGIIGTSRFASLTAPKVKVLDVAVRPEPQRGPHALPALRDAGTFEALRDRADALSERPVVFLATLGSPAAFGPRATEAANFLAAGGIVAEGGLEGQDSAGVVEAFRASGARVACLCGTTDAYATEASAMIAALREAGARMVLVAGACEIAEADGAIGEGCNALRVLGTVLDNIGP
jgi:methylmalonyl-CoA mutase